MGVFNIHQCKTAILGTYQISPCSDCYIFCFGKLFKPSLTKTICDMEIPEVFTVACGN